MAQCMTPLTIKNKKPNLFGNKTHIAVPCGKCKPCLNKRSSQWAFRLSKELEQATTSAFITYTYSNENLPRTEKGYPTLSTTDYQSYMKRQRRAVEKMCGKKYWLKNQIKYYYVGEYGGVTNRPHYHAIMFNLPEKILVSDWRLEEQWKKGHIQVDNCEMGSIRYVTNYIQDNFKWNSFEGDDRVKPFSRMSKGIGKNYLTDRMIAHMKSNPKPYIIVEDGKKQSLPRYYKEKAYNEEEKKIVVDKALQHIEEVGETTTEDKIGHLIAIDRKRKHKKSTRDVKQKEVRKHDKRW